MTSKPQPEFNFTQDGTTTNKQLVEEGIQPLYLWGSEGWARVRQIRLLQEECRLN